MTTPLEQVGTDLECEVDPTHFRIIGFDFGFGTLAKQIPVSHDSYIFNFTGCHNGHRGLRNLIEGCFDRLRQFKEI